MQKYLKEYVHLKENEKSEKSTENKCNLQNH